MARRAAMIKKTSKVARTTRSEQFLVNRKYLGDEPVPTKLFSNVEMMAAFNWYNAMCSTDDARSYLKDYLKTQGRNADLKKLSKLSDSWVPVTAAWIARLESRGFTMPATSKKFLEKRLAAALERVDETGGDSYTASEEAASKAPKPSIQARMREKAGDIIAEIEALIDSGEDFSLYDWLQKNEIPAAYMGAIATHYAPWLDELLEAYEGTDEQLKEAYRGWSKKKLKERILFFNKLIEDTERFGSNIKKVRKPRKPRTVSTEKKLKHLRYQKENNEFKLASVNPEKILGAQELWTFDTKYKILTVFRAIDRGGLQVNRSSITGFDEKNSFSKRTGRKPEAYVEKVLTGGKINLRKVMDELKIGVDLKARINENTILLKVVA